LRGEDVSGPSFSSAYEQVVWVYRAINVLAEQVANIPFLFSRGERGSETLITSGPLPDFYARPHPQIDRFQYWELRVIWLMLRGECVRVPIFDAAPSAGRASLSETAGSAAAVGSSLPRRDEHPALRGTALPSSSLRSVSSAKSVVSRSRRLSRVLILDPARFQHIVEHNELIGWRYTGLGPSAPLAAQVFLPEEVWFEKLPNPFDFWRGLSPLRVAGMAARTDFAAGAFMQGIIENNGDAGVIVRTQDGMPDEQKEQIIAALTNRKRRAGLADRPVVLEKCVELVRPELTSSDLQFLENRKFTRAEICAAFGVPEEIICATEHAKYDVMEGARLNFIENRVAPLCSRLEAAEAETVRALDSEAVGWFDLDSLPILQKARLSRLAAARTGFEMGVPFNELNRVLDLGFRSLPWGDRGYVPSSVREASSNAEPQSRKSAEKPPTNS
jgi:HK97 family phage portal protein